MLLGVDVGGTFTDAVLVGRRAARHTPRRRPRPTTSREGVLAAVARRARARRRAAAATSRRFAHGMTVATNALLEGHGARTALVATEGFTDVVELGRQARARPLPAVRGAPRAARAARAALRRARAHGPRRRRCARSTPRRARRSPTRSRGASPRRSPSCCCTPTATPSTSARSARRCAERCRDVHVSLSHEVGRHVPRVRARRDDRDRRRALAAARAPTCGGSSTRARGRGPARARDHAVQRRPDRRRRAPPRTPR